MNFAYALRRPGAGRLNKPAVLNAAWTLWLACAAACLPVAAAPDYSKVAVSGMNVQISPGDDFFRFVNGTWEAAAVIPADHDRWGDLAQLSEDNWKKMAMLYEDAARIDANKDVSAKKVGLYYTSQLDDAAIERMGMAPIQPQLQQIAALKDKAALAKYLGASLRDDVDPVNLGNFYTENLFGLWVGPDLRDARHYMPYLLQGGLGMPERDSYLSQDAEQKAQREAYRAYVAALLEQAGVTEAFAKAERIVDLETAIAKVHATPQASADLAQSSQVWRAADFTSKAPGLDWPAFFKAAGLAGQKNFGAWQPEAIKGIAALVATTPLDTWKAYLRFHAVNAKARYLPHAVSDKFFAFYDPFFLGPDLHFPRWIHAVNQTNAAMPGAGRLFVEHYFSPAARTKAVQMANNIIAAFGERIDKWVWMESATKKEAKAKLNNIYLGMGYPDTWLDSKGLDIQEDDPVGNTQRIEIFNYRRALAKLGRKVDREEWIRGAELFGCNRMPLQNAITISAFELQTPFFDLNGSDAVNYAAIGSKIGQFISLFFNEKGRHFDAQGRVRTWWSEADLARFRQSAKPLVAQASAYQALPGVVLNGQATLNQNLADLAGLQAAFDAYRMAQMNGLGMEDAKAADQRFFIAYAKRFRDKLSEPALRGQALGSPIPPGRYRAALVRNLDAWYASFDVAPGQGLYLAPEDRVKVW